MNKHEKQYYHETEWLGTIIKDSTLWEEKTIHMDYFFDKRNQEFYSLLERLIKDKKPLTQSTWLTLSNSELHHIGGKERIEEVINSCQSTRLENLLAIEKEMQTYFIGQNIIELVKPFPKKEVYRLEELRDTIQKINDIGEGVRTSRKSFSDLLIQTHDKLMNLPTDRLSGVDTGYNNLNAAFDGWEKKLLYIIGARPSVGKTAFTVNSHLRTSLKGDISTYIPAETGDESIIKRMICMLADLPADKVKNPNKYLNKDEMKRYHEALQKLMKMNMHVEGLHDIGEIKQLMRERKRKFPNSNHVCFIDHLAHLSDSNRYNNKNDEYEAYCKALKDMAVELDIAVVLLSQLSRENAKREDKRGQLTDLRDSGSLEQIADVVAFLHRPNYFLPDDEKTEVDILEFIVRKNRDGELGTILFKFTGQNMRIVEA